MIIILCFVGRRSSKKKKMNDDVAYDSIENERRRTFFSFAQYKKREDFFSLRVIYVLI
jgi:hypothetical protein